MIWIGLAIGLIVGLVGGFFIGIWVLRRSMANMQWEDKDISQMAKRMGMNLNPKQMQVIKQQMKKNSASPPPLFKRWKGWKWWGRGNKAVAKTSSALKSPRVGRNLAAGKNPNQHAANTQGPKKK